MGPNCDAAKYCASTRGTQTDRCAAAYDCGLELLGVASTKVSASKPAVFFDLGNTLAAYYNSSEFQPILRQAIACVAEELGREGVRSVNLDSAIAAATLENREADEYRFMPMRERLSRIFGLDFETTGGLDSRLCRAFVTLRVGPAVRGFS
jgi:hypothetical protein